METQAKQILAGNIQNLPDRFIKYPLEELSKNQYFTSSYNL